MLEHETTTDDRSYAEATARAARPDRPASAAEAEGGRVVAALGDYPILHSPTISLSAFSSILRAAGSPAAPEAAGVYNAFIQYGVDPAVGLALFQHESGFGRAGVAVRTHGIGNLRYYGQADASPVKTTRNGTFAGYANWTAGALGTARLLASTSYGKSKDHATVRTFPFRWAPAADHNKPAEYGASLARNIAKWTGSPGTAYKTTAFSPATHVSAAVTKATKVAKAAPKAVKSATASLGPSVARVGGSGTILAVGLVALAVVVVLLLVVASRPRNGGGSDGA
jgi:hypothetical protein